MTGSIEDNRDGGRRSALTGSIVSGIAAALWSVWGGSGLAAGTTVVTVVGVVLGAAVAAGALVMRRRAAVCDSGRSMFSTRRYRLTVVAEVVAVGVGAVVLRRLELSAYIVVWTALVVGLHFLVFGRSFARGFTPIGGAVIGAALAGAVVGIAGAGDGPVRAVTGLLVAAVLLVAGARRIVAVAAA